MENHIIHKQPLHYAYLSGEHETIPSSELGAILEAEGINYETIKVDDQLYIFSSPNVDYQRIISRVAYTKELGKVLTLSHEVSLKGLLELVNSINWSFIKGEKFMVKAKHIKGYYSKEAPTPLVEKMVGEEILEHVNYNAKVNPIEPNIIVRILFSRSTVIIGLLRAKLDTKYFLKMRPRKRPFFHPGVLEPKISRAFVNFSRVRRGDVFLDPFCGTGGFLIEACNIGAYVIGYDIKKFMSFGAKRNLSYYDLSSKSDVLCGDATLIPLREEVIDAISTDPPYGRASSTLGRDLKILLERFLEEASIVLKRHRYVCFASPHTVDPLEYIEKYGFKLLERHIKKVHRGLIRVIYVIRKEK